MKNSALYLLASFLFSFFNSYSFDLFHQGQIKYFKNSDGEIRAIRIDSTKHINDQTEYFNFNEINTIRLRHTLSGTYLQTKDRQDSVLFQSGADNICQLTNYSWVGKSIHKTKEQYNFKNIWGETITLHPQAPLDSTWVMYRYPHDETITATIISVEDYGAEMGLVKTIQLTHYDKFGVGIDDSLSMGKIKLSTKLGLHTTYNFLVFPNDPHPYELFAWEGALKESNQILTNQDLFNYNVGDEFHLLQDGIFLQGEKQKIVITNKEEYQDSIVYEYDFTKNHHQYNTEDSNSILTISESSRELVVTDLNNNALGVLPFQNFDGLNTNNIDNPSSLIDYALIHLDENGYNLTLEHIGFMGSYDEYFIQEIESVCRPADEWVGNGFWEYLKFYTEGMWPYENILNFQTGRWGYNLVYVNTNHVLTGEPLDFVVGLIEPKQQLELYPTISSNWINVPESIQTRNLQIYSSRGMRINQWYIDQNRLYISSLSAGNYIIRSIENGEVKTGKFTKQ